MHVLIIGASKGIGRETARLALQAGHRVRAFARSAPALEPPDPRFEARRGDALDAQDVADALVGMDVVVQTLGVAVRELLRPVHLFSEATRVLVAAMQRQGVRRLISVTGFGAGASRASISCVQRLPFELLLGRAYRDKGVQERLIEQSGLEWTIARPGVLTDGPRRGRYRVLAAPAQWRNGMIARADVADFLVRQIDDSTYLHQAPVLVD
jgi:putative NADH-flavin reductase